MQARTATLTAAHSSATHRISEPTPETSSLYPMPAPTPPRSVLDDLDSAEAEYDDTFDDAATAVSPGTVTLSADQFTHLLSMIQSQARSDITPLSSPRPAPPSTRPKLHKTRSEFNSRFHHHSPRAYPLPRPTSASSSSPSLPELFPALDPALLRAITQHTLSPHDLYKLSLPRSHSARAPSPLPSASALPLTPLECITRFYPSPSALVNPLSLYFRILLAAAAATGDLARVHRLGAASSVYVARLVGLCEEHHWTVVLPYHVAFHERRLAEMRRGDYAGWAELDLALLVRCLGIDEDAPGSARRAEAAPVGESRGARSSRSALA
ncbi:hypothetical protein IEO21_10340 [Rhodonia placenta]|uniref:Uncharacterized protein n=1 Tax=Rhodonia placenta TaxID=104341 RepID=A0A8H7TXI5_9APHY|nr:hypothetical protein IEO21_10340 [Postia placenta]